MDIEEPMPTTLVDLVHETLAVRRMAHHFQPIWDTLSGQLLGFEALARFPDATPDQVFAAAVDAGVGVHLDRLSAQEALRQAQILPGLLFVNINPNHMGQSEGPFGSVGSALATFRHRRAVVFEITEQKVEQHAAVDAGILRMRRRAIALALDDAGTGNSDASRLKWIKPRFVKVAQPVIEAWQNGHATALLRWVALAKQIEADLIAEGVEDVALLKPLARLGIRYVQGYATGRPEPAESWLKRLEAARLDNLEPALSIFAPPEWDRTAGSASPLLSVTEIGDIMYSLWPFPALIVDCNNRVVGMNLRAERHFGVSLEHVADQPAEEVLGLAADEPRLMHISAVLPGELPVGELSHQKVLLHRHDGRTVAANLTMIGIRIGNRPRPFKLIALMPDSEDSTLPALLGQDPLSGLPTRAWWERERPNWDSLSGSVIFLDVDGLKQVNDLFGHQEGDRLLTDAGRLIHYLTEDDSAIAVRYGGDEFLVVLKDRTEAEAEALGRTLAQNFQSFESISSRVPATFSFGTAAFQPGTLQTAIAEADRRLLEHKGLLLGTQRGSRLVLTASGRRALWTPIQHQAAEAFSLDRIVQHADERPLREAFTRFIDLQAGMAVVEVNAGRGQIGFLGGLVERLGSGGQYLATDHNGAYLTRIHRQWQALQPAAGVHFLRTAPDRLPIVSQSADFALVAFALPDHDPEATLRDMVRVTQHQGRIAVGLIADAEFSPALEAIWNPAFHPQSLLSSEELQRMADSLSLTVIRENEHRGALSFDTLKDISLWLAGMELESHNLINLLRPGEYADVRPFAIQYHARFWLFQCP